MIGIRSPRTWMASAILGISLCGGTDAEAQTTYAAPKQYYSPTWKYDGVSSLYGARYRCFYYWKPANQNYYLRYDVYYYPEYHDYIHFYNSNNGTFLYKCASRHHPAYNYWSSQWCDSNGPADPTSNDFDPNAPPTPGNPGLSIPRPPCPPDMGGGSTPPGLPPEDPT